MHSHRLVHVYGIFGNDNGFKAIVFTQLCQLCQRENSLSIIVERARNVEQEAQEWNLTLEEKQQLFLSIAQVLDKDQDPEAYKVMHAYLRTFERTKNEDELKKLKDLQVNARRCIILAIKACQVINFEEILDLKAIKSVQQSEKQVFEFLSLFVNTDVKDFNNQVGKFESLMKSEGLSLDEVTLKKQYVQICSIESDGTNFSYKDLASMLNIDKDEVEAWAIEAIANNIIDAKIDQLKEEIVIKNHMAK